MSRYTNPGERLVQGQRIMRAPSDIYLGWTRGVQADRYFYWRQLRDMKGSALVENMSAPVLNFYAELCGWTLARAKARSGDATAIATYLGDDSTFEKSIADFSVCPVCRSERAALRRADVGHQEREGPGGRRTVSAVRLH